MREVCIYEEDSPHHFFIPAFPVPSPSMLPLPLLPPTLFSPFLLSLPPSSSLFLVLFLVIHSRFPLHSLSHISFVHYLPSEFSRIFIPFTVRPLPCQHETLSPPLAVTPSSLSPTVLFLFLSLSFRPSRSLKANSCRPPASDHETFITHTHDLSLCCASWRMT